LLCEVDESRTAYETAKLEYQRLVAYYRDLALNHPDGRVALRKASSAQDAATDRYAKALGALTHFMIGKPLFR
jgi:hypothetical protein